MPSSRKISASGDVVDDSSSSESLSSGGHHVDVFGFNLDVRQLLVTLALVYLMLGPQGSKLVQCQCSCQNALMCFCSSLVVTRNLLFRITAVI
jgi:hypothetical protein